MGLADADLPALFRQADRSSLAGQRRFLKGTKARLVALLTGGVAGSLTIRSGDFDYAGIVAAAAFLIALSVEVYLLLTRPDRVWYEGRAVAESAKTTAWRYGVGGEPFLMTLTTEEADRLLLGRLKDLVRDLEHVSLTPDDRGQITEAMSALRGASLANRKEAYRRGRIEDQRAWYTRKSAWNETRARQWTIAAIAFEGAGVVLGVVKALGAQGIDWLAVIGAASAAIAAWVQTKQYQTLSRAYAVAALELGTIADEIRLHDSDDTWGKFVQDAEEATSREHTLWRASRGLRVDKI
jgi:hypothetical protein